MQKTELFTGEMLECAVKAIRKAYHAALLAPADWEPTEFDAAPDCLLVGFGLEVEDRGPAAAEHIAEEVRKFVRGGDAAGQGDTGPIRDFAHELGDNRPSFSDMKC